MSSVAVWVCEGVCQAMGAPTIAPIVTKLGQQMLHITCSKVIAPHLRSEAVLRPKARVERGSSLLVGGIAASLTITRATPGTSASYYLNVFVLKLR